uniref:Uncharacterized protein n=1 Tax=Vespula pensylvanica TaxID=30213 RepID=A0A834UA59_VESPE|nr:hypothetical protein H0235_007789 [Vespula pensylvanica]
MSDSHVEDLGPLLNPKGFKPYHLTEWMWFPKGLPQTGPGMTNRCSNDRIKQITHYLEQYLLFVGATALALEG